MIRTELNEKTINKTVLNVISKPVYKKHVAGIGYVYYFDGGHAFVSGKGFNRKVVVEWV